MEEPRVLCSTTGHIARITLNRPQERNAMTLEMGRELSDIVDRINGDDEVRVVVVRGAGSAFSSGGNLKTLAAEAGLRDEGPEFGGGRAFYRSFLSVRNLRVPSIAAMNGHAIGAGLCLALACDLRVAHERAKMGMTFVRLGIHPGMAATWTLPRLVGPARAADLLYTGRVITAAEALDLGLVNRVAGDDFDEAVDALAGEIAGNGPIAVRALKETLAGTADRSIEEAIEREADAQAMTFTTEDAREGLAAVLEKRTPQFTGR
ncbi:MAG: enoyl-CoA hydratase/isomerase family protein [Deltaproteobacteria bacterium]|nr:MAG: enoyl-CoA hydratase/isomerase family protein [Deltaproteobacteria bacterium]